MNAKGLLVTVDGLPLALRSRGFDLAIEEHPRYTFHFEADPPPRGRLVIQDTNFASSEGTSRLALRGRDGVVIRGDDLPTDVDQIEARPVWQLSDLEERRTKELEVDYETATSPAEPSAPPPLLPARPDDGSAARPRAWPIGSRGSSTADRGSRAWRSGWSPSAWAPRTRSSRGTARRWWPPRSSASGGAGCAGPPWPW